MTELRSAPVTVGRLLCGGFRDLLSNLRVQGYHVDWHESHGWIERVFMIRAEERVWKAIGSYWAETKAR